MTKTNQHNRDWRVTIAKTFEEIEFIRPFWEEILSHEPYPVINPNINRFKAVLTAQKDLVQPYVMLFHHQDRPIAIAISRIERHRFNCRIGYWTICKPSLRCLSVIYGGIPGQPSTAVCEQIIRQFQTILKQRIIDVVYLHQVHSDSNIYKAARKMTGFLYRSHFQQIQQHWQTLIPSPMDDIKGILSKKHHREICRCIRNLEKACSGPVKVVCYRKKEDIRDFITVASRISSTTYQNQIGRGFVADPLTLSLLTQAIEDRWLRAYVLYAASEPVAFEFGCVHGDGYFAETAGFDPKWKAYSPGTILQLKIFESLGRDDKVVKYDYGFGDATYKQRFGNISWPETSEYIFAPALYPIIINLIDSAVRALSISMHYLIQKFGLTNDIKRWWRNRFLPVQTNLCKKNTQKQCKNESELTNNQKNITIRLATEQNIDQLTDICRVCFPEMLRWRGPKFHSRKWWRQLLESKYCQIWLSLISENAIGFIELDLDKTQSLYHQAWEKHRPGPLVKLYMFAACPKLFIRKALQKLKQHKEERKQNTKGTVSNNSISSTHEQPTAAADGGICWIRRVAVIPGMQGKGVATEMYRFCFQKVVELGYKEVVAMIERDNIKSLGVVKKLGFEIKKERDDTLFYRKVLKTE